MICAIFMYCHSCLGKSKSKALHIQCRMLQAGREKTMHIAWIETITWLYWIMLLLSLETWNHRRHNALNVRFIQRWTKWLTVRHFVEIPFHSFTRFRVVLAFSTIGVELHDREKKKHTAWNNYAQMYYISQSRAYISNQAIYSEIYNRNLTNKLCIHIYKHANWMWHWH